MFQLSMNKSPYCVTEDTKVLQQVCSSLRAQRGTPGLPPALLSWQLYRPASKTSPWYNFRPIKGWVMATGFLVGSSQHQHSATPSTP